MEKLEKIRACQQTKVRSKKEVIGQSSFRVIDGSLSYSDFGVGTSVGDNVECIKQQARQKTKNRFGTHS